MMEQMRKERQRADKEIKKLQHQINQLIKK
jgi:hypothetical protein